MYRLILKFLFLLPVNWAMADAAAFLTPESEYRLGESVMIPLHLDAAADERITSTLEMDRAGIVEVIREPEFLAGQCWLLGICFLCEGR